MASSEERYDDAAADYVRASMRPGIDPQAAEVILKLLGEAMKDLIDFNIQVFFFFFAHFINDLYSSYTVCMCVHKLQ